MFAPANQAVFTLIIAGLKTDLQVSALTGREAISEPFSFDVELVSEHPAIDLNTHLHKQAFLQLSSDGTGIHGQVYRAHNHETFLEAVAERNLMILSEVLSPQTPGVPILKMLNEKYSSPE